MKSCLIFATLFCWGVTSLAQYEMKADYLSLETSSESSDQLTFRHLQIYPIYAGAAFQKAHQEVGQYDNLKQALEEKKVRITELGSAESEGNVSNRTNLPVGLTQRDRMGDDSILIQQDVQVQLNQLPIQQQLVQAMGAGAQVNKLMIENMSSDSIFLMAGEVVKGGKQDRVLAQDVVLPPNSGPVDLGVFCVEHSRWSIKEGDSAVFGGYFGVASNRIRKVAVVDQNQSKVWENVDVVTRQNKAMTSTKSLTALTQSKEYQDQLKAYEAYFVPRLINKENCVGFVGITADRIIGMDVFATPDLFQNQMGQLLHAFITESISDGGDVEMEEAEVLAYMMEFLENEANQAEKLKEKGHAFKHAGKTLHLSTY